MKYSTLIFLLLFYYLTASCQSGQQVENQKLGFQTKENIAFIEVNPKKVELGLFLKNKEGKNYSSLKNVKEHIEQQGYQPILFMNAGMYLKDQSPQGLYIENGIQVKPLDTVQTAYGNFYMQPNGVFYIENNNSAGISTSKTFSALDIKYATQSGPMLVINGQLHPKFNKGSTSTHYRNGVGILPNGNLIFAISTEKVNFFDFASFFQEKGCVNALYLDGFVSRAWFANSSVQQLDGQFGVIIGLWNN